jgi:hypothetical protein
MLLDVLRQHVEISRLTRGRRTSHDQGLYTSPFT